MHTQRLRHACAREHCGRVRRLMVNRRGAQADWDIVKRGWDAHVLGEAPNKYTDPLEALKDLRGKSGDPENPVSDQHLEAFVIVDDDKKAVGTIEDGDAVVIFNFRADRVVELSKAFEYEDFTSFDRCALPCSPRSAVERR